MKETKSVKALKKQLGAAVAMVCVAAVALGTSTYAWFVSNNQVTANTSGISAQSNAPFLVISKDAITESTTTTEENYYKEKVSDTALFPVQMVEANDDATTFKWESAYASDSSTSTEKDKTRFIVQSADYDKYFLKQTFHVGANGTTKGQFKNLRVSGVSVTQSKVNGTSGEVAGELENALRVMVVCEKEVAIYDKDGKLITQYIPQNNTATNIGGLTEATKRNANGTETTAAYLTAEDAPFPATSGTVGDKTVDVYVYYDGAVTNINTDNLNMLGNVKATITFTADDYAASKDGK